MVQCCQCGYIKQNEEALAMTVTSPNLISTNGFSALVREEWKPMVLQPNTSNKGAP